MGPNTEAHGSCSAMLNGELFVFGVFQISKIVDCELKRIGSLPVHLQMGLVERFYLMALSE